MSLFLKNLKSFSTKYLQTQHPEKTNTLVKTLLNKEYNKFINEAEYKNNYEITLSNLKSIQTSFSHDKESKLNRQIIFNSNEALRIVAYHHRTLLDHKNYSLKISESEIYNVYKSMIFSYKDKKKEEFKKNLNLIYRNNNFNPIISNSLFASIPILAGLFFKHSFSLLFGIYSIPLIFFTSIGIFQSLNEKIQIKSINYFPNEKIIELELFSIFGDEKVIFKRNMVDITSSDYSYKITDGIRNFYISKYNSEGDFRLLNHLMNPKLIDKNVEDILLSDKNHIDFSCDITSQPNVAIDSFIRKEIIKNNDNFEKLSHEEIYLKSLEISDRNVKEYLTSRKESLNKEFESFEKYFEEKIGLSIQKSIEITNLLIKKFYYSSISQLKFLNDEELKEISIILNLTSDDIEKIKLKIK